MLRTKVKCQRSKLALLWYMQVYATQMNVQHSLIQKLMHYKFKLDHYITEASKNIYCIKSKGSVDCSPITRWSEKSCLGCKFKEAIL